MTSLESRIEVCQRREQLFLDETSSVSATIRAVRSAGRSRQRGSSIDLNEFESIVTFPGAVLNI